MKRLLYVLILSCVCIIAFGKENKTTKIETDEKKNAVELIEDAAFETGFGLTPLRSSEMRKLGHLDTLYFKKITKAPIWRVAQWNSKHNLTGVKRQTEKDGSTYFANAGKRFARYPDGSLFLGLNASAEYEHPRIQGEPWPHLLIEQKFRSNPLVSSAKKIFFSMELMLVNCENKMSAQTYVSNKHTAQSPFFLNIKDSKSNSFLWFGIRSFDYRFPKMSNKPTTSWDIGTRTFISTAPPLAIWGDINFNDKQWHKADVDILPYIREAFETVKSKGHFPNTKFEDLIITGMNFGWEIPGTFEASLRVKNISLKIIK